MPKEKVNIAFSLKLNLFLPASDDADVTAEAAKDYLELSPDRRKVYRQYFLNRNATSEEDTIRWAANMMHDDPDIFAIFRKILAGLVNKLNGGPEAKKFLRFVSDYNLI